MGIFFIFRNGKQFQLLKEFPVHLLARLEELTGHETEELIVVLMEYGPDFSGPDKDTFRADRAVGDPLEAHKSNFLHPVLYYYKKLPSGKIFNIGFEIKCILSSVLFYPFSFIHANIHTNIYRLNLPMLIIQNLGSFELVKLTMWLAKCLVDRSTNTCVRCSIHIISNTLCKYTHPPTLPQKRARV